MCAENSPIRATLCISPTSLYLDPPSCVCHTRNLSLSTVKFWCLFLKSKTTLSRDVTFSPPPSANLCVCVRSHSCESMCTWKRVSVEKVRSRNRMTQLNVACHQCTWQIIRHAFRASFFQQLQKQGHFTLRVNVIIETVWLRNQIRTCHRTGCMVMLESVVAQVCKTGESIPESVPGKACWFILIARHCFCNAV